MTFHARSSISPLAVGCLSVAMTLALGACSSGDSEQELSPPVDTAEVATETTIPAGMSANPGSAGAAEGPLPVVVRSDTVALGSALGADGSISAAKSAYAASDTVYVAIPTAGHAPGAPVRVYWTNMATGVSGKQDTATIGTEPFLSFAFSRADGMEPGSYNVQVDVDEVPVGILDFTVE